MHVTSQLHRHGKIDLKDLDWRTRDYNGMSAYEASKLATALFSLELQRRLTAAGSPVRSVVASPGIARTSLAAHSRSNVINRLRFLADDPEIGALALLYAATQHVPGNSYVGADGPGGLRDRMGPSSDRLPLRNGGCLVGGQVVSGVIRCLRPLPVQLTCGPVPRWRSRRRRAVSSEARSPVWTARCSMAWSRRPVRAGTPNSPRWLGDRALVAVEDRGRLGLVTIAPDGTVDAIVGGDRQVLGFDAAGNRHVAMVTCSPTDPGEISILHQGIERPITSLNAGFRERAAVVGPTPLATRSDGHDIDLYVYLPRGDRPVPAILYLHGGPATQVGWDFLDDVQAYVAAGIAVILCNPRGASGRGQSFLDAVLGDGWGQRDCADAVAALDAALHAFPRIDGERLGLVGGSYGAFLACAVMAGCPRFRSVVLERGLLAWDSVRGCSDIGAWLPEVYLGAGPADDARLRAAGALCHAHAITVPTLIIHGEQDHRCPIEQSERLFVELIRAGTPTTFIRFPDEGHGLSRTGSPRHRVERLQALVDWHRRHLASGEPPGAMGERAEGQDV